jgi:hypothetical protein
MIDDSYLVFNEKLEPYEQYPGKRELFEELQVASMVAGSCYFGSGVACSLANNLARRVIIGALASGAKYKVSYEILKYVRANERIRSYQDYLQTRLTSGKSKK